LQGDVWRHIAQPDAAVTARMDRNIEESKAKYLKEISPMAHKNSGDSRGAAGLVTPSQQRFTQTNEARDQMVVAMDEINAQSGKISRIIRVIDGIAF
jgi:methyl-accepting chemotaxis protein